MAQFATQTPPWTLIAETQPTVAAGLRVFLDNVPGVQPVAIMTGFDHVVEYAEGHEIALIIVGEGMNRASPLTEFQRLRERNPLWRLVLLTDTTDRDVIMAGLAAGASGVISTSVEEPELHSAVTRILAGSIYIPSPPPVAEQQAPASSTEHAASTTQPVLTPRQFEVLGVLSRGNSNKKIAQILGISDSTVSMHLNAVFQALGVRDRTSAALAYRNMAATRGCH